MRAESSRTRLCHHPISLIFVTAHVFRLLSLQRSKSVFLLDRGLFVGRQVANSRCWRLSRQGVLIV